ncbi:hypothetical protein RQP53_03660 [Paucibacter sp. APW11]|uniref:Uncharacterized protein n=1 Tax=Roseateles aquae TaxID=3077235 RepID=A0ABU3P814_9BURK|nr:hypothetical protein [Paucibacter sp. APW11]MDT8998370.1 hypothetical protein [Paucibacter sp. APW11]
MQRDLQPTSEDLQTAWDLVAHRDWPSLHELALAAARYKVLQGAALRVARGERVTRDNTPEPQAPAVQTPAHAGASHAPHSQHRSAGPVLPSVHPHSHARAFDAKRAAAGDRDDD